MTTQYPASITIAPEFDVRDIGELFHRLSEIAARDPKVSGITSAAILERIRYRESQSPTAVGSGLLLPHARLAGLETLVVVFGKLTGIPEYETPDDQPLETVCLILIPETNPVEGLRFMADLGGCIRNPETRARLTAAGTPQEMASLLAAQRTETHTLVAADIMVPARLSLNPEMKLKEATKLMAENHLEALPVLDGKKLVGEISSVELFKLGIPDFFSQLKSVGFIRYFDPFEKYFAVEAASKVGDVMTRDLPPFYPDATLIEIVFAISVLRRPTIYIVNYDSELQGVISQAQLLERIINL